MRGRVALGLALVLISATAAAAAGDPAGDGGGPGGGAAQRKQQIDARINELRSEIADANAHEGVLTSQLSGVTAQLRAAQAQVDGQQARLSALEMALATARTRLAGATVVAGRKTTFLRFTQDLDRLAQTRLERRLRALYLHGKPDTLSVFLAATSFSQLLDDVDYAHRVARQDREIAAVARRARAAAARARLAAEAARADASARARELAARTKAARAVRDRLAASRDTVASARSVKAEALAAAHEDQRAYIDEVRALEAQSAVIADRIRAAQASPSEYDPPSGAPGRLQWPVSGPITSGFGMRWGRMHEGIDIAVGSGTPVHAAAAGRVVYAGWMSGYGNIVVLDHGGGLSSAYGHNTSVAVAVGQDVQAGQVIAYSGSTGHSTGPHVHFEVRVNGEPVDPMGYL
jgi:murein DD-endopeptidase MepM/ murein hydrolase activator NlpD